MEHGLQRAGRPQAADPRSDEQAAVARDIVAALVREGFNLRGGDFREVELCKVHDVRRCTICLP